MSKRDDFIALINTLKGLSTTISDEQRKGLLQRGVQQYSLTTDEATDILNASGLSIGEQVDYFDVLDIALSDLENRSESDIVNLIEAAHKKQYSESLKAGGRPRADGRTEEQWRTLLNQARDALTDQYKRQTHLTTFQTEELVSDTPSAPLFIENMALIPKGEFEMGSNEIDRFDDEKPVHTVFTDEFYIDQYPVTNADFKIFVDENPQWSKPKGLMRFMSLWYHDGYYLHHWYKNDYPEEISNHPVAHVSWYAAMAYAEWKGKRLPTEAEWEKAARGGLVSQKYPWGNTVDYKMANYGRNIGQTTPVGRYPANGYELYDMPGNVWEWCLDEWDSRFYMSSPTLNPVSGGSIDSISKYYTSSKAFHVIRGGSWYNSVKNLRVAKRGAAPPTYTNSSIGFRCAMSVKS